MIRYFHYVFCLLCAGLGSIPTLQAALIRDEKLPNNSGYHLIDGKLVNVDEVATLTAQEHYNKGVEALNAQHWEEAANQFNILVLNYPQSIYGQEGNFFLAVCYYRKGELESANESFNAYLKSQSNPRYFLETIEHKFAIAERFRCGAKRCCFGYKVLPKWASGYDLAIEIYNEVSTALPHDDIAAKALFSKANLLWSQEQYRECVEAFKMVIRRFPKHELAPESYLSINQVFLQQSRIEFQNPDILDLALINLRKFKIHFPNDERVVEAEKDARTIEETYARGLFNTGDFYQRTAKPNAAIIYYRKAMVQFPDTVTAEWCRRRLCKLCPEVLDIPIKKSESSEGLDSGDDSLS